MSGAKRYRISTALLHDGTAAWANLGLWATGTPSYAEAAAALADRHWHLAQPAPGSRLLDAGCGYVESLRRWQALDPTVKLTALEVQPACIEQLVQQGWPTVQGRFDTLPLPAGLPPKQHDTLMCIDAAYHASSLRNFSQFAAQALATGGVLVFSTLLLAPTVSASTRRRLRMAGIPSESQVDEAQLQQALNSAGFKLLELIDLNAEGEGVLAGFSAYATQRARALTLRQRLSPAWWKIAMTGRLCARLSADTGVRYALIKAEYVNSGSFP